MKFTAKMHYRVRVATDNPVATMGATRRLVKQLKNKKRKSTFVIYGLPSHRHFSTGGNGMKSESQSKRSQKRKADRFPRLQFDALIQLDIIKVCRDEKSIFPRIRHTARNPISFTSNLCKSRDNSYRCKTRKEKRESEKKKEETSELKDERKLLPRYP